MSQNSPRFRVGSAEAALLLGATASCCVGRTFLETAESIEQLSWEMTVAPLAERSQRSRSGRGAVAALAEQEPSLPGLRARAGAVLPGPP